MQLSLDANINSARVQHVRLTIQQRETMVVRFVDADQQPFSWSAIATALSGEPEFRHLWNQTWANIPFDFLWQPVPIHSTFSTTHPFFAVLVPSSFAAADPSDYQAYLQTLKPDEHVTTFSNLSGDALLVVPQARGAYGHIAAFCRLASVEEQQAFWKRVGEIATAMIEKRDSLWCNTHGHGVPWLHLRFDRRLKYFTLLPDKSINDYTQALWYQNIYRVYNEFNLNCSGVE